MNDSPGSPQPFDPQTWGENKPENQSENRRTASPPNDPGSGALMNVRIRLGTAELKLQELLRLRVGDLVTLDQRVGAPVEVLADGRLFAIGQLVTMDDHLGVQLLERASELT